MRLSSFVAALAALSSSACAFNEIPIRLPDAPLAESLTGGNGREVVVRVPFLDERGIKRCGRQINGYGMDTANAICQSNPSAWIAERLRTELRGAGFSVVEEGEAQRPTPLEIDGALLRLFVEPKVGLWIGSLEADLEVELQVSAGADLSASRTFFVKGWKGGVLVSTLQPYHTSLHRASQAIVEEMVRAVIELMDRHPEIGRHAPSMGREITLSLARVERRR